jgi:hypothetical protein
MNSLFRRYTTLPILLDILYSKRLTLSNPSYWDDKNDSYFIDLYRQHLNLKSILILCFAETKDTYHHWKIFAGNNSGVCIVFNKKLLLECFPDPYFRHDKVEYEFIKKMEGKMENNNIDPGKLPFLKRKAFKDEREYRIICEVKKNQLPPKEVPIPLNSILKIIINPWMPKTIIESVKSVIHSVDACGHIDIFQTTTVDNENWKNLGKSLLLKNN